MMVDSLTGLHTYGFLHAHLERLISDAEQWDRQLSVAFFDVKDMSSINARSGYIAGDRLLRQIGSAIGRPIRSEDLSARYGGDQFCIVLPETEVKYAAIVMQRTIGVITNTEFATDDQDEPVRVVLRSGSTAFRKGDTAQSLMVRVRRKACIRLIFDDGRSIIVRDR
ncbi:MAG: diguanylate cyclase [Alphaproteobacteria bacterium]|nr:diguanylate cyclase [Alphaproteobacteria bacterium]